MMVPLYGFLHGDTIGLVVLARADHTIAEVAHLLQEAASVRVAPRAGMRVFAGERLLDPEATVADAGLAPLARIDVVPPPEGA